MPEKQVFLRRVLRSSGGRKADEDQEAPQCLGVTSQAVQVSGRSTKVHQAHLSGRVPNGTEAV